jgi:glycosyltransferase involved in cell wall biosynthesis
MTTNHPRLVIIASSGFNQFTGGGVFLTNLFRGWPRERIAIVHGDPAPGDDRVCQNHFKVGPEEIQWAGPFGWWQRMKARQAEKKVSLSDGFHPAPAKTGVARWLRRLLGEEMPWNARLSPDLKAWLDAFRPEIIYTLAGGPYMRLVRIVAREYRIPVVAHMMDDWPAVVGAWGLLGPVVRRRLTRDLENIFREAALRLTISDAMTVAYEKRYRYPFAAFCNPSEVGEYLPLARNAWVTPKTFRIAYIGTILSNNQRDSLLDVARAVDALNHAGEKVEFHVYSAWSDRYRKPLEENRGVHAHPPLDDASTFKNLVAADLLLIPVNFDQRSQRYIRYSMPAKVPFYMVSGTPILVYGPEGVASVDYARRDGWAMVVSERKPEALRSALRNLMRNEELREKLARTAQAVVQKNHDAVKIRADFQAALIAAAQGGNQAID